MGKAVAAPDIAIYRYVHILYHGFYTDSHNIIFSPSSGMIRRLISAPWWQASLRRIPRVVWQWSIASMCTAISLMCDGSVSSIVITSCSSGMMQPSVLENSGNTAPPLFTTI